MTLSLATSVAPAGDPQPDSEQSPTFEAYPHQPVAHELRNAWVTAKQLEERLEIADQPDLQRIVRRIREQLFIELMHVEGYQEVDDVGEVPSTEA